jgi:hypothetical protein
MIETKSGLRALCGRRVNVAGRYQQRKDFYDLRDSGISP